MDYGIDVKWLLSPKFLLDYHLTVKLNGLCSVIMRYHNATTVTLWCQKVKHLSLQMVTVNKYYSNSNHLYMGQVDEVCITHL